MKRSFLSSSFRYAIFFIFVLILFTLMVAAGLRNSSGTVIPTSTVTAAITEPAEPPAGMKLRNDFVRGAHTVRVLRVA